MTTVGLGIATGLLTIILLAIFMFAKKEGRYHIMRGIFGGGLDELYYEPKSNEIKLSSIKWNGKRGLFQRGKEGLLYTLELIRNPDTPAKELYNKALSSIPKWSGSKRSVVMSSTIMSFVVGTPFYAAVTRAKKKKEYEAVRPLLNKLEELFKETDVEYFSFLDIIDPKDLSTYLKDVSAEKVMDAFKKGDNARQLLNTKPREDKGGLLGGNMWWYLILAVGAVALIWFFVFSGIPKTLMK